MSLVKPILRSIAAFAVVATVATRLGAQTRPQLLIIGSFHMANPAADFANVAFDDVLSEKRQREIADLVARLARFRPTKVAVEAPATLDQALQSDYQAVRTNRRPYRKSETEQVGFRVAASLGHDRIFGIDVPGDIDVGGLFQFAAGNGQIAFVQEMQAGMQATLADVKREVETLEIPDILLAMNRPEREQLMNSFYLRAAQVSKDTLFVGPALTTAWYARNLKMYSLLHRAATSPNDRVLVVIGAGHAALLRKWARESGAWDVIDPVRALAK